MAADSKLESNHCVGSQTVLLKAQQLIVHTTEFTEILSHIRILLLRVVIVTHLINMRILCARQVLEDRRPARMSLHIEVVVVES